MQNDCLSICFRLSGIVLLCMATVLSTGALCSQELKPPSSSLSPAKTDKEANDTTLAQDMPNIIILTTHDTGLHLGCYGVPTVETPAIDGLAREGVKFTKMFSPAPICSPSRGSLQTGQWPERNGLLGLAGPGYGYELDHPEHHISHTLRANGYHTVLLGHQHVTGDLSTLGFDEINSHARLPAPEITTLAADFLRNHTPDKQPFYLQIGFHETHTPFIWGGNEPESDKGTWLPPYTLCSEDEDQVNYRGIATLKELKDHIAGLQSSIERADQAVDILLKALDETGLSKDTIILFNTEHGPELPRAKWTMYDPGTNVAFIMRWPNGGIGGGKTCDALLSNVDFLPTLAELTGIDVQHPMDGKSFAHLLNENKSARPVRTATFMAFVYTNVHAVRTDKHKLIRSFGSNTLALYDLERDPLETNNLVDNPAYAEIRAELDDLLWEHLEDVNAPILSGVIEYPHAKGLREEYESRKGNWGDSYRNLTQTKKEGPGIFEVSADDHLLRVNFTHNTTSSIIQLYDLGSDPLRKENLLYKAEYAELLAEMKEYLWSWLEDVEDPILEGKVPPSELWEESMRQYKHWKKIRSGAKVLSDEAGPG